jgi:phage terminase large subunit-like protein
MNYIKEYYNKIISGEIITSKRVRKQYERLVNDIDNPTKWIFDEELGERAITFIEQFCKQSKGEWFGKPIKLQLFQKAFIQALFGFIDKDSKVRRFKETFFLVARKNGKSTLLSGILLYMLVADGEGGAECYTVATKKDQAKITFNEAVNMVNQSPYLSKHLKKRKSDIYFPLTYSKFEALASDSNSLDGLNSHCVVIDELHAIKDRNLYEVMKQSMSARRQPLLVMITTSGTVRECIYDDMYDYACKVVDGLIEDDRFLPILYELDERAEWTNFKCWEKANPGLGTIKKIEDITEKVERGKSHDKDLPGILCKDFNIRDTVNGMWLNFEDINNTETFDMDFIKDSYCLGGVDLSSTTDLTCATLLIMKKDSNKKYVLQQYFIPEECLEKKIKEDQIPYDIWHKNGLISLCEGNKVNYSDVTEWFNKMVNVYDLRPLWIGYDPWNSQYWVQEMRDKGYTMEEVRQGFKTLSQPMKELEAELKAHNINYNNNPILKWCLTNTSVKYDENGNIKPVKGQSQKQRIDGSVSLLIAYTKLFEHYQDYTNIIKG